VRAGFEQNSTMFRRILDAFMEPYQTTIWMYRILFGLGVVAFVAAIGVSIWLREPMFALVFGGLSVGAFLSYFISRPIRALEGEPAVHHLAGRDLQQLLDQPGHHPEPGQRAGRAAHDHGRDDCRHREAGGQTEPAAAQAARALPSEKP
jgi:hypothetical protein